MRRRRLGLPLVLLGAAVLRLAGLTWGLPHRPTQDERVFVQSAWNMRVTGSWDPGYYEYPGLIFDLLAVVFRAIPAGSAEAPPLATAVARGVIAAFGVASVSLAYAMGNRLLGRRAGLFAAALLAVSPVEVEAAHLVRPDVVLEAFVLATFLPLAAAGRPRGPDVAAGLALGAALATKLTGLLLVPVYAVGRLLGPDGTPRRLALDGLLALAVFLALTRSLLFQGGAFLAGVGDQWAFHYTQAPGLVSWVRMVAFYGGVALRAIGPVGLVLAVAGMVLAWGDLRSWLPIVLFPAFMVVVLATAVVGHDRLLVPALGLLTLLAAGAFDAAAEKRPDLAPALVLATLAVPLAYSLLADWRFLRSGPYDRALQWLEGRPQTPVLFLNRRLGLGSPRFHVREAGNSVEQNRLLARHFDLVAAEPEDEAVVGFRLERPAEPEAGWPGPRWPGLAFFSPGPLARRYAPVDLMDAVLSAAAGAEELEAVRDGRPDTAWSAAGEAWLQVDLPAATSIGRAIVEGRGEGCAVGRVWTAPPGGGELIERTSVGLGPALVWEPVPTRAVRLAPARGCTGRWRVPELRIEAAVGAP